VTLAWASYPPASPWAAMDLGNLSKAWPEAPVPPECFTLG